MDFMGIGPMEVLVILIIALIVFGPTRLPEIGAQIGKFVNQMKQAGFELTRELNKEIEESKKAVAPVTDEVKAVAKTSLPILEEATQETPPPTAGPENRQIVAAGSTAEGKPAGKDSSSPPSIHSAAPRS